jgi:hypothetical protein
MPFPYLSKSSSSLLVTSTPSFPRSQSRASGYFPLPSHHSPQKPTATNKDSIFASTLTTILVGPTETAKEFKISKNILYNESSLLRERLTPSTTAPSFPLSSNLPIASSSTSFSTTLTTTPSPADEINTIYLPSILPSAFSNLNYWFYTHTIPISATPSATHADILARLHLYALAEFLGISSLEERLYEDLRWLSYHSLLRPDFPSTECLAFVFSNTETSGVKNKQVRHLLVRCFVYEFLRQTWRGDVGAIKKIAESDAEFRMLLTEEMSFFGAVRRGHPFLDKDLETFENKGRIGKVLLKKYGQLRESKRGDGVMEVVVGVDGTPIRKRSKRGGKKRMSAMGMGMEVMGSRLGPGAASALRPVGGEMLTRRRGVVSL